MAGVPEHFWGLGGDVNLACYTEDTQTLTENGWKYYYEIREDEKIATYNPETNELEYNEYNDKLVYQTNTDIYFLKNQSVDVAVTHDHDMWIKRPRNNSDNEKLPMKVEVENSR